MSPLQRSIESLVQLISFPSVSSTSNQQVSNWVSERLQSLGFKVEHTTYRDENDLEKVNVVGRRDPQHVRSDASARASEEPFGLAYFCHTDVVPAVGWTGPGGDPFQAHPLNERLYGRGSCDMKGSLAAMLAAAEQVPPAEQNAPLWIVCTADEEVGFVGAKHLIEHSEAYRELVSAQPIAIIGEPTRLSVVHAHKGIIGMRITSHGRAAHSSSTDGVNANRRMVPLLQTLLEINEETQQSRQYMDERFDPPTLSWNFGVSDDCKAINITPDRSVAWVSLRPMPRVDGGELIKRVEHRAQDLGLEFEIFEGGSPLWIEPDAPCIRDFCDLAGGAAKTVCYGTDGGEFDELNHRVVFGPGDIAQAHTTDEWIELDQLQRGIDLFAKATRRWCVQQGH